MGNKELLQKLVALAQKEVGTREEGNNNCGKDIREYQKATWLALGPWAWCAALICYIVRDWLKEPEVMNALGLTSPKQAESWRPKTAGAFDFERWAKSKGLTVLPETALAKAGDLVIFDFSHIGIVTKDQVGNYIDTIEGNTNGKGERDSITGDGVWEKKRHAKLTKSYIRLLV